MKSFVHPLPNWMSWVMLAASQIIKLGIILSDPQSKEYKYWFYQCFQYPPYSFNCHTIHGDLFPMAYSLFWYAIYVPLTSRGYWTFSFTMLAVDSLTGMLVARYRSQLGLAIWVQGSLYFLLASPQDFLVWTLILASWTRIGPIGSVLAVLTKFPLLPPIFNSAIWNYIFFNPYSVHDPMNWARYTLIGSYWTFFLVMWLRKRKLLHKPVNSLQIDAPPPPLHGTQYPEPPRGSAGNCHRTSPSLNSRHIHHFRLHRARSIQWSPIARDHRPIDLRSDYTLRSYPPHTRQERSGSRTEDSTPKPQATSNPKALNSLTGLSRLRSAKSRIIVSGLFLLLALALITPYAHASSYVGYGSGNIGGSTCGSNCIGPGDTVHAVGQTVKAPFAGTIVAAGFYVGGGAPTQIVIGTFASPPSSTTANCGGAGTDSGINSGQSFTVQDVESLSGVTLQAFNTVNLANPISVSSGEYVSIQFMGASSTLMLLGTGASTAFLDTLTNFGTSNPVVGNSYSTSSAVNQCGPIVGGSFTIAGTVNGAVTQCYGNCGTPAVTLANTNSTHSTNFNNSITLFYQAQSNLNGFVLNVTAQVAKNYGNGQTVAIGLYTVDPACTVTNLPFTPQCPGFQVQHQGPSTNPSKGAFSMTSNIALQNGQWFGIAVTGAFQGLDLNDTNTNVVLYQASGQIPTVITQFSNLGNSKVAVYAFVRGNTIISGPNGNQIPSGCQTISCGIIALWNSQGGDVAAGLSAFLIVFFLVAGSLLYVTRQHDSQGRVTGFALPMEILGIIAVVLLLMFSAIGVIPAYVPAIIIFLVAGLVVVGLWGHKRHSNTMTA